MSEEYNTSKRYTLFAFFISTLTTPITFFPLKPSLLRNTLKPGDESTIKLIKGAADVSIRVSKVNAFLLFSLCLCPSSYMFCLRFATRFLQLFFLLLYVFILCTSDRMRTASTTTLRDNKPRVILSVHPRLR